jgi:hypothetical protein
MAVRTSWSVNTLQEQTIMEQLAKDVAFVWQGYVISIPAMQKLIAQFQAIPNWPET